MAQVFIDVRSLIPLLETSPIVKVKYPSLKHIHVKYVRFRPPSGGNKMGEWEDGTIRFGGTIYDLNEVDILPPVEPSKIICVAGNYIEHIRESGYEIPEDLPERPGLFLKPPNAVASHGDCIELPTPGIRDDSIPDSGVIERGHGRIDYEGEFAVVIGRQGRNIPEDAVEDHLLGYTCMNDISNRDDQGAETNWVRGKAFDNSAPLGPVISAPENVPSNPRVQVRLNGETVQDSNDDELVFSVPEVVAEASRFMTLERGDVIAMGTTRGVGELNDGDKIEVEVEGVETLIHTVVK